VKKYAILVQLTKRKEYCETIRQSINEMKKEAITCLCGAVITRGHMARHYSTSKHKQFINGKGVVDKVEGNDVE
jgi:hypothetical protein